MYILDSEYITHKNRRGKKKRFEVMSQHHSKDRNNNFGVTSDSKPKSAINSSSNSEDSAGNHLYLFYICSRKCDALYYVEVIVTSEKSYFFYPQIICK